MKNLFCISMLAFAALFTLPGCDDDNHRHDIDYLYSQEFVVENKTDEEIAVEFDRMYYSYYASRANYSLPDEGEKMTLKIAPGKSETVFFNWSSDRAANPAGNMKDVIDPEDAMPLGQDVHVEGYEYPYTMIIGGEKVPESIWLRKQWAFWSNPTSAVYTLVVTDELLNKLAEPGN